MALTANEKSPTSKLKRKALSQSFQLSLNCFKPSLIAPKASNLLKKIKKLKFKKMR